MASSGEELLISADSHVIEDPHFWQNRLPAALKDQAPVFPEREVGGLFQAHPGGWDPHERVKEMAVDGVSGEVLYPSFAMNLFGLQNAALQEACFRVYNDWILEYCSVAPDRLYGVSCIATYDIDHGVAELERCRKAGLPGALVWQTPPPEFSFATDHYERLWAAAQDLEVPISLHILTGQPFPWPRPVGFGGRRPAFETMRSAVNSKLLYASNAVSDLIMTGVLERYPRLKFVLVENEVSWIPFYLTQYDKYWGRGNLDSPSRCFPASTSIGSSTPRSSTIHQRAGSSTPGAATTSCGPMTTRIRIRHGPSRAMSSPGTWVTCRRRRGHGSCERTYDSCTTCRAERGSGVIKNPCDK